MAEVWPGAGEAAVAGGGEAGGGRATVVPGWRARYRARESHNRGSGNSRDIKGGSKSNGERIGAWEGCFGSSTTVAVGRKSKIIINWKRRPKSGGLGGAKSGEAKSDRAKSDGAKSGDVQ